MQSQFSRNKLEVGPRTRNYKPKGPSRSRLKFDNTRRAYPSVHVKVLSSHTLADGPYIDHDVSLLRKSTSTSLVRSLLPLVRSHKLPFFTSNLFPVPFNHISFLRQVLAIVALRARTNTTQSRSQYAGPTSRTTARTPLKLVRSHMTRTHTARLFACTLRMPVVAHAQTVCTLTCM